MKLRIASIVFLVVALIAMIPLTLEVFGRMDPDTMMISAVIVGIGLLGSCVCTIIRSVREIEKKMKQK